MEGGQGAGARGRTARAPRPRATESGTRRREAGPARRVPAGRGGSCGLAGTPAAPAVTQAGRGPAPAWGRPPAPAAPAARAARVLPGPDPATCGALALWAVAVLGRMTFVSLANNTARGAPVSGVYHSAALADGHGRCRTRPPTGAFQGPPPQPPGPH